MLRKNPPPDGAKRRRREPLTDTNLLLTITICIFVGMYLLAMVIWGGGFLNPQQFINMFNNNAWLIIVACGLTVVMISGGIDISVGGVVAVVTMACVLFIDNESGNIFGSILLALGIGLGFGLVQGFLVAYLEIQPFIVTLAGMFFSKGMITVLSPEPLKAHMDAFVALKDFRFELMWIGSTGKAGNFIPARVEPGVLVALAVVLVIFIVLRWTKVGRNLYAVGGNSQSAMMLGINAKRTRFYAYLISGLLSGIAGYVFLLHTGAGSPANATFGEIKAIASSIIGGTLLTGGVGNVVGTLFGVMTLLTIDDVVRISGLNEPWWQSITTGAMLCFFILLQSVVLSRRGKGFKLQIPEWLKFVKKDDKE